MTRKKAEGLPEVTVRTGAGALRKAVEDMLDPLGDAELEELAAVVMGPGGHSMRTGTALTGLSRIPEDAGHTVVPVDQLGREMHRLRVAARPLIADLLKDPKQLKRMLEWLLADAALVEGLIKRREPPKR